MPGRCSKRCMRPNTAYVNGTWTDTNAWRPNQHGHKHSTDYENCPLVGPLRGVACSDFLGEEPDFDRCIGRPSPDEDLVTSKERMRDSRRVKPGAFETGLRLARFQPGFIHPELEHPLPAAAAPMVFAMHLHSASGAGPHDISRTKTDARRINCRGIERQRQPEFTGIVSQHGDRDHATGVQVDLPGLDINFHRDHTFDRERNRSVVIGRIRIHVREVLRLNLVFEAKRVPAITIAMYRENLIHRALLL